MAIINTDVIQRSINNILWLKRNNRPQYIPSTGIIEALAELAECELQRRIEGGTAPADALPDTIGALHTRNKSLQKGLATLTRRVQELETALAAEKERGNTLITPRGMETYNSKGVLQVVMGAVEETKTPTAADSPLQADIDARIAELEEQLKKEIGAQASMQAEIDRLRVTEAAYRNHLCPPRSAADTQLQADIKALTQRVSNLEFAATPGYYDRARATAAQAAMSDALNATIKEKLADELRMGGIIFNAIRNR